MCVLIVNCVVLAKDRKMSRTSGKKGRDPEMAVLGNIRGDGFSRGVRPGNCRWRNGLGIGIILQMTVHHF